MKASDPKKLEKNFDYPEKTEGSELAARARQKANSMTEEQRREHFRQGMQIIYGGSSKEAVRTGH